MGLLPSNKYFSKWVNDDGLADYLQVADRKGGVLGWIDGSGIPRGSLATAIPPSLAQTIPFSGIPTGSCTPSQTAVNTGTGDFYSCSNGAWTKIGPTAGSLVSPITSPNPLAFDVNVNFKGPNPYADVTRYGVRSVANAVPATPGITAGISSGSSIVAISNANNCPGQTGSVCFKNGDGVVIFGAGAPHSMVTPIAPTVTPSVSSGPTGSRIVANGPAGSTSYSYQVVARDAAGGLTAAGPVGTTVTGQASLGAQSVAITSFSRSGQVVTCTTSTAHTMAARTMVYIFQASDGSFSGWYSVATVPDNTHFTFTSGFDTASGASSSATGGTANWFNCNHLTWTHVEGAFVYYIYGRTNGSLTLLGQSFPDTADPNAGGSLDGSLSWDDFGSPMMDNYLAPYLVPTTPPASATSDSLVTTIISGAGTASLTLANSAGTTVAGNTILFDNAPNLIAAANANNILYIPNDVSVIINSFVSMPSFGKTVFQTGAFLLNDTIQVQDIKWYGDIIPIGGSGPSFSWGPQAGVGIGRANPGVQSLNGAGAISGLQFSSSSNNTMLLLIENGGVPAGILENLNFSTGGSDYMGIGLMFRSSLNGGGGSNILMLGNFGFIGGSGNGSNGSTATPLFFMNGMAPSIIDNISMGKRGILVRTPSQPPGALVVRNFYENGAIMPPFFTQPVSNSALVLEFESQVTEDTLPHPLVANLGGSLTVTLPPFFTGPSGDGVSVPPIISGNPAVVKGATVGPGYDLASVGFFAGTNHIVTAGSGNIGQQMTIPLAPASAVVSSGGSVPVGTVSYSLSAIDINGNQTTLGPAIQATVTTGNQTVTIMTPAVPPFGAINYALYRNGIFLKDKNGVCTPSSGSFTSAASGLTFVDTSASACSQSPSASNLALSSGISSVGIATPVLTMVSTTFANLGTPINFTVVGCSDCTIANPCAGSGSGALAKRLNGVWVCN